jgi:adenylate kinase
MPPQSFIFIGRYGAGKGTQAKSLIEELKKRDPERGTIYVETGAEFRKFMASDGFTAKHTHDIVTRGNLMPEFMCVYLWGKLLVEEYTGVENLIFDGTPRKLLEAKALEALFPFYGLEKPWVIYLDVEHGESHKRISLRASAQGRVDDGNEAIEKRRAAYEADVVPTIEWYRANPNVKFLDIDGHGSIEAVHEEIVKRTGLK